MSNFYFNLSKILNPLLNPVNFLFLVLLLLLIIFFKKKLKIIFRLIIINISLIIVIGFLPLGKIGLNYLEKDFKNINQYDEIKNIVVLSGSDTRIIASIELAKNYSKSKIYYIGGNPYVGKKNPFYDRMRVKKFYKDMGFDMNRIYFIGKSRNTIENFNEIRKLYLDNSKTILLTSAYHMKRSMMIAKQVDLEFLPYAIDLTSETHKSLSDIYKNFNVVNNMGKFSLFIREIIGIIAFKIFY